MEDLTRNMEPKEVLNHALGMVQTLAYVNQNEGLKDALEDVIYDIRWVLKNATMYKNREADENE